MSQFISFGISSAFEAGGDFPRKRTRKKHTKSRLGCPQCKKRKIKCDESLPSCTNCINKNSRCGYLDYTKAEIQKIKDNHKRKLIKNNTNIVNTEESPTNNNESSTSVSSEFDEEEYELLKHSNHGNFNLKQVKHQTNFPKLDISKHPEYFDESLPCFLTRNFILSRNNLFIYDSFTNFNSYNGRLLFGYGVFLRKYPFIYPNFLKLHGMCIGLVLKDISNLNDYNAITLLRLSICLDLSAVYLKQKESYKSLFKFSTGPLSILRQVYENPLIFPNSFPKIRIYGDAMLFNLQLAFVQPYKIDAFFEFYNIVNDYNEKFIKVKSFKNKIVKNQMQDLLEFIEFSLNVFNFEGIHNDNDNDDDYMSILRYPYDKLYEIYQKWFSIFPPEYCVLDCSTMNSVEKVFYVFWFTTLKFMESYIVNCRYAFSYFLDGYFLSYIFRRTDVEKTLLIDGDDELKWFFNYSCRVIAFFNRRHPYILANGLFKDPNPEFISLKKGLKLQKLDIFEKCVESFTNTVIQKFHYPQESINIQNLRRSKEHLNYYMMKKNNQKSNNQYGSFPSVRIKKREDIMVLDGRTIDEYVHDMNANIGLEYGLNDLETSDFHNNDDGNIVDLANGINPKTSMLRDDYDPRFLDTNIFDNAFSNIPSSAIHKADIRFLDIYLEDKRLMLQTIDSNAKR